MTQEARRLMHNNSRANASGDVETPVNKSDVHCLRCVTDGLKLIHKGQDFVKDVLSRVVTYELYDAFQSVPKKTWEDALSCYYILNGAVEVTYDMRARESRNVYQANIIYSHGTGEYVGLVSPEGPSEDLAPPATIYTKELTQFIRVDRTRFHKIMKTAKDVINDRKISYISSHSFLSKVSSDVKEKILHKLTIHVSILRNFKNATFYVDCFLYWVDLMLFPIQYFILSCHKQQLTVKQILLRPFILTLPRR